MHSRSCGEIKNGEIMREYDDKKLIRSGSFGSVYKVKKGDAFYALKEMTDKGVRDREEKFLKLADHPLFPKFEESYDEDGKYYILEEYILNYHNQKLLRNHSLYRDQNLLI